VFWYGRWIAAAREEEVPAPGDWRVVRIGTQSIAVLRDEKAKIRAFHNTCRHRGSILCTGERGTFARKRIVADVKANWKLVAENFSECFHCPPVHPELCRIVTAYREAGAWGLKKEAGPSPEYKAGAATLTLDGSARLPAFRNLNEEEKKAIYTPYMFPPNLFLNVQPDYVNSHLMFPTGPESVRIVYDWLFEPRHLPLSEADLQHYVALWEVTNAQDARNCEWQQQGVRSREFKHGHFVPQEFDCFRFTEWVRGELEKNRDRPRFSSPDDK